MKRIFCILLSVLLSATFSMGNGAKRVAILYFDNSGDAALEKLKKGLADMLITDLSTVKMLSIVERARLEEILKEQKLNNSKSFDAATASKLGKLLGAEIILTGGFFELMGTFRVDARFIDVQTGKILKSDGVEGETKTFFSLEKQLVNKIITNLDVTLSEDERTSLNNSGKQQEISYQAAMIYSGALQASDDGNALAAAEKLNVVLAENPTFEPAKNELAKISPKVTADTIAQNKMRGSGDPLKGLNVSKSPSVIGSGKYYALIIGIDKYSGTWPALNTAVNDAKKIEAVLTTKYKFDKFITLYDAEATRAAIFDKFEWLVENISENDNVMIYYSGHGDFKANLNKGYWIPADASASVSSYISNNDIQTFLAAIKSKHTLMVSDACFSGDIFRGNTISVPFEESEKYYKQIYSLNSRKAISSGGIEPVMDGGKDGHSVFAYYFIKTMETNKDKYFDASQLFNSIKVPIVNNSEQTPMFQPIKNTGDEGGQFVFILKQ